MYASLITPLMEYGYDIWTMTQTQNTKIDIIQNMGMRTILNAPRDTHSCVLNNELGMLPFKQKVWQKKLNLFHRLETSLKGSYMRTIYEHAWNNKKGGKRQKKLLDRMQEIKTEVETRTNIIRL